MDTDQHRFSWRKQFTRRVILSSFATCSDLCASVSICGFDCLFQDQQWKTKREENTDGRSRYETNHTENRTATSNPNINCRVGTGGWPSAEN